MATNQFPFSSDAPAAAPFGSPWGPVAEGREGLQQASSTAGGGGFLAGTSTPGGGTRDAQVEAETGAPDKLLVVPPVPERGAGVRLRAPLVRAL